MCARLVCAVVLLSVALPLAAQPRIGLDVGAVVPTGALGMHRSAGVAAAASVGARKAGASPRLDIALAWLPDDAPTLGGNAGRGDYTSAGARLSLVYRVRSRGVQPYGVLGGGLYVIDVEGEENPYGSVSGGVHAGGGLEIPAGTAVVALEVSAVVMTTDYGVGAFNGPTVHVPLTVGVRF